MLENRRQANGVATKIIEVYLEVRRELCGQLSDLAALRAGTVPNEDELLLKRDAVANLLYRYYDFMPKRVLQEMNCLYACLGDRENRLYAIRDNELRLADKDEVIALITEISLVDNSKYYALVPLQSTDRDTRRACPFTVPQTEDVVQLSSLIELGGECRQVQFKIGISCQIRRQLKADYLDRTAYMLVTAFPMSGYPREWTPQSGIYQVSGEAGAQGSKPRSYDSFASQMVAKPAQVSFFGSMDGQMRFIRSSQ